MNAIKLIVKKCYFACSLRMNFFILDYHFIGEIPCRMVNLRRRSTAPAKDANKSSLPWNLRKLCPMATRPSPITSARAVQKSNTRTGINTVEAPQQEVKNPLREIIDPFINLFRASRALWGINLSYLIEGLTYFGVLGLHTDFLSGEFFP